MDSDQNQPLPQNFQLHALQYYNNYVRNMDNQMFLSQYHINHFYILLLIRRTSPWDDLKPNSAPLKDQIDQIVETKVVAVKRLLQQIAKIYALKSKQTNISYIQKLMGIIKAKKKSIIIQRIHQPKPNFYVGNQKMQIQNQSQSKIQMSKMQVQQPIQETKKNQSLQNFGEKIKENLHQQLHAQQELCQINSQQKIKDHQISKETNEHQRSKITTNIQIQQQPSDQKTKEIKQQKTQQKQQPKDDADQILGIFFGLSNITDLSMGQSSSCIDFNPVQKYVKFKMNENYTMTIKNQDLEYYDQNSILKNVPADLFVNKIFPYLTASQLFKVRFVCKEWYEHVKQTWHGTFKRQMLLHLLAREYYQEIEFHFQLVQLRNPFFQKLTLLLNALVSIIEWDKVCSAIINNTINQPIKRVLIVLLKLIGQLNVPLRNVNNITQQLWNSHKEKIFTVKQKLLQFFSDIDHVNSDLSIQDLRLIKQQILDNPFMRLDQMHTEDRTYLLLSIFIKQLNLQQIIKRLLIFGQQYLLNIKKRLDNLSGVGANNRGLLQTIYKILLLRPFSPKQQENETRAQSPNVANLLRFIFQDTETGQPDFVLRSKSSITNIYLDKATKLDIVAATIRKLGIGIITRVQDTQQKNQQNKDSIVQQKNIINQDQENIESSEENIAKHSEPQ